jgi:hypothetical protein
MGDVLPQVARCDWRRGHTGSTPMRRGNVATRTPPEIGIARAVALDPANLHYWLNGARMVAHDLPRWRLEETDPDAPSAFRTRILEDGAQEALTFLQRASPSGIDSPWLQIEAGAIHWSVRGDYRGRISVLSRRRQDTHKHRPVPFVWPEIACGERAEGMGRLRVVRGTPQSADSRQVRGSQASIRPTRLSLCADPWQEPRALASGLAPSPDSPDGVGIENCF